MDEATALTKYEIAQIVSNRALLLNAGAVSMLTNEERGSLTDPISIALRELSLHRIQAVIVRGSEYVDVQQCVLPCEIDVP